MKRIVKEECACRYLVALAVVWEEQGEGLNKLFFPFP